MVNKIFKFINKEIDGLHQAAYLLGFFAIMSQILALIRDRLLAGSFGAGGLLDMYYAAFRIPDFVFVSVGSMVSISVLIPFLITKMKSGEEYGKRFVDNIFSVFFLFIIVVSGLVFLLMPFLASAIFPGFSESELLNVVMLSRILLLSPILLGLSNLLGTLTQIHRRFFVYALSPILYNIGIILGVLFLYPMFGVKGLAYGVILGAILHVAVQLPFIVGHNLFPRFSFNFDWKEVKQVLFVSLPRTFTLGSGHISMIFLVSFASLMTVGSISVFNFSYNLQSVPISIIGVSYSLAAFPTLVKLFSNGEKDKFVKQLTVSARHIIFWSLPLAVLFIVLRAQIVRTILGSGNFNWTDTRLTAAALAIFTVSLVFQNLTLLFVRAYYSVGNTKKPFWANIFSTATTIFLAYIFILISQNSPIFINWFESIFKVSALKGTIVLVLPLAYSVGEFLKASILWILFQKDFNNFSKTVFRTFGEVLFSSLIMGFVSYFFLNVFDDVFNLNTTIGIFLQGFSSGILGIMAGMVVLILIKNRELISVGQTLKSRIWKKQLPTAPDASVI